MKSLRAPVRRFRSRQRRLAGRLLAIPAVRLVASTVRELGLDDAPHMAAGVAFYAILSLFPLLLALIAVLGWFLPSETLQDELFGFFERNLPGGIDILEQNIREIIRLRGTVGLASVLLLLWSASTMFGALSRSINRAWGIRQDRPYYVRKLRDLAMALGIGVLFLLSFGAGALFSVLKAMDVPVASAAADFGSRFVGFFLSLATFLILYKLVPRTKTYWRHLWPGALLAAFSFEIAKTLFILYLSRFADYASVYGSVASVIILLVWIYLSAFIAILGAEFSAEIARSRANEPYSQR